MLDGHQQGDTASHAVADDVGLLDAEVLHQRSDVIRYLLVLQGAVNFGGAAIALQIDTDDSPTLGQLPQQSSIMPVAIYASWSRTTGTPPREQQTAASSASASFEVLI